MSILILTSDEEYTYNSILKGIQNGRTEIDVSKSINDNRLLFLLKSALSECSSLINCDSCHINTVTNNYGKVLIINPVFSGFEFPDCSRIYDKKLETICDKLLGCDTYTKVKKLYEYFLENIRYDYTEARIQGGRVGNVLSHIAYGALVHEYAVCEGISYAFSAALKRMRIESMVVSGTSKNVSTGSGPHAWNIVNINEELYHIDVTWGINSFDKIKEYTYDYFCLCDKEVEYDHKWDKENYLPCENERYNYYQFNDLYAESIDEIQSIITTQITNDEVVNFKISNKVKLGLNPTKKIWSIVSEVYKTLGYFCGSKTYTYDKNKRTFFMK